MINFPIIADKSNQIPESQRLLLKMSNYLQARQRLIHSRISPSKRSFTENFDHNIPIETGMGLANHHQQSYSHSNPYQKSSEEYQAIIDFQLAREKEKNRIYEERLRNKEIFIEQMRQHQQQLTKSFENCQKELLYTKRKFSQLQNTKIRQNLEEIAQLKHLVIRLEHEITMHENQRDKDKNRKNYSSVNAKDRDKSQRSPEHRAKRKQRSKTLMYNEEETPKVAKFEHMTLEDQMSEDSSKIANFLSHFLGMIGLYCTEASAGSLKSRLKVGWRWIKNVVKEWHFYQREIEEYSNLVDAIRKAGEFPANIKISDLKSQVCDLLRDDL